MILIERNVRLTPDEGKTLTEFEHKLLNVIDDTLFQNRFAILGTVRQTEKLQYIRVFHRRFGCTFPG